MGEKDLLARAPYGNGEHRQPLFERSWETTFYKLMHKSGWNELVPPGTPLSVLRALRAEVVRGVAEVESRLPPGSPGGIALARTKAILLGRLDTRIALRRGQLPPQLPHDAREPSDSELSAIRVDVRQCDYIRCVWCGLECGAAMEIRHISTPMAPKVRAVDLPGFSEAHPACDGGANAANAPSTQPIVRTLDYDFADNTFWGLHPLVHALLSAPMHGTCATG